MRNKLILNLLAAIVVTFFACKKDEATPTNTEILLSHNWQIKAATINPAIPTVGTDFYGNYLKSCQKDDFLTFYADNNAVRNEGGSKCETNSAQTNSATWAWQAGETQLNFTENNTSTLYAVLSVADTALVVTNSFQFLSSTYTVTSTFKKP